MTQQYWPFDAGAGSSITEDQWRKMARHWLATGILECEDNEAEAYGDSSGMQVKVGTGKAWIRGHYRESDAEETLSISAADPADDRIDRVILRADFTANTIALAILEGTPAGAPTAPSLTQSSSRWEITLAQVAVGAGVSTIAAANVTDERTFIPASGLLTPASEALPLRNESGSGMSAGDLVYVSGWDETNRRFLVSLADADAGGAPAQYVLRSDIANNANGIAYRRWRETGQNTGGAAEGDPIYLSTTAGAWALAAPTAANAMQLIVGRVTVVDGSAGEIEFLLPPILVKIGSNELQADVASELDLLTKYQIDIRRAMRV